MIIQPKLAIESDRLILTPFDFLIKKRFKQYLLSRKHLLNQQLYQNRHFAVLTGFIGYPSLLTTLFSVAEISQKTIFFVGSGGIINKQATAPQIFAVRQVSPDTFMEKLFGQTPLQLKNILADGFPLADVITTDFPQREDNIWLENNRTRGLLVEMELFPLSYFFKDKLNAFIVSSDRICGNGIESFNSSEIKKNLENIFNKILEFCHEKR